MDQMLRMLARIIAEQIWSGEIVRCEKPEREPATHEAQAQEESRGALRNGGD